MTVLLFRFIFLFFLSINCVAATETNNSDDALQWLEKMSQAMQQRNYQGTVVFAKNGHLDTMKYFHATDANGLQQERLLSLNSPMREVIRDARKVHCFFKESAKVLIDHRPISQSFLIDLPNDFSALKDVYAYSIVGDELVAMLPTKVISIEAKDKDRFDRKIWIDKEYFLPLKEEVYDLEGKPLKQVVFTEFLVSDKIPFVEVDKKTQDIKVEHIHRLDSSNLDGKGSDVVLENIPLGFKIEFFTRMENTQSPNAVDHLLLSDGFSSISVYREVKANDSKKGLQALGAVNIFTHFTKKHQITAMGEAPATTVQSIAQGVNFR
jgi:sigma-E factor negative regulatory protein RseB